MGANFSVELLEGRQLLAGGTLAFAFPLGTGGIDRINAQVTDSAGNLYLAGVVGAGTVDFNPSPRRRFNVTAGKFATPFIAKYTADGALAWARLVSNSDQYIQAEALGIDRRTGDLLVGGEFSGTVTFAPGMSFREYPGETHGYWARINPRTGAFTAVTRALVDEVCNVSQIDSDAAGNVYLAGSRGQYNMDSHEVMHPFMSAIVVKFNARGRFQWEVPFAPHDATGQKPYEQTLDPIKAMAITSAGQVYIAGQINTTNTTNLGFSGPGAYLVSLNTAGAKLFAGVIQGSGSETINDLAVDAAGNVLVAGTFSGAADFDMAGGDTNLILSAGSQSDGFLAKYSPAGQFAFIRQIGADGDAGEGDAATSVAVDAEGYVYVGGSTWGTTYFNPGVGTFRFKSGNNRDGFVAKYKARGTFLTAWLLGGPASDEVAFLSAGPGAAGPVFASGELHGVLDADPGRRVFDLTPVSDPDIFVVKLL